jgi:2-phosphosulfolactate phosphatase
MPASHLNVHSLPAGVAESELSDAAVIVVDLLRASTTICQALASGAREVVPFSGVEDTLAAASSGDRREIVLGGERGGLKIAGFDLGNSPSEYTPKAVGGRRLFITTTNGTRALYHARRAARVLVGAIVNMTAVVASVAGERRVDILCAGTGGQQTGEDILAAGALISRLAAIAEKSWTMNSTAEAASSEWQRLLASANQAGRSIHEQLALELRNTPGGRNLLDIGLDQDLADCAQVDRLDVVPELDVYAWRIHLRSR